ncbi:MAG TPA: SulP family inorganic anion transporter [Mycobacterium sp.]|nr:SulP family inorganic anion transporter [Mycobacterium sp.]
MTARAFGERRREPVDNDQELLALGAANLSAAVLRGFPVSSRNPVAIGLARTRLPSRSGAARPLSARSAPECGRCREQHCLRRIGRPEGGNKGSRHDRDGRDRSDHQLTRGAEDRVRDGASGTAYSPSSTGTPAMAADPRAWGTASAATTHPASRSGRNCRRSYRRSQPIAGTRRRIWPRSASVIRMRLLADRSGPAAQSATPNPDARRLNCDVAVLAGMGRKDPHRQAHDNGLPEGDV